MKYFDNREVTDPLEKELDKVPAERYNRPLDPDPEKGMQEVADLLTYLPENERLDAVKNFVAAMLLD